MQIWNQEYSFSLLIKIEILIKPSLRSWRSCEREKTGERLKKTAFQKTNFFEFSVHQCPGKTDWLFAFGLSITESGKYASCLVQQIVTFLNEFIHSVKLFKTIILSKDKTHIKNDKTKFLKTKTQLLKK